MSSTTTSRRGPPSRIYTREDVSNLIAQDRKVIIVDGKVLKVDAWLPYHPGGDKAILHMVGRDATDEVNALHSLEARAMMNKYIIGSIEGQWVNYLPPIQGGVFKQTSPEESEKSTVDEKQEHESESSSSSETGSPIFDGQLRRRRQALVQEDESDSETSMSSFESIDLDEVALSKPVSAHDHSEEATQRQIEIDLAKYPDLKPDVQHDIVQKYRQLNQRIKDEGLYDCNYWAYAIETARYLTLCALSYTCFQWGQYLLSGLFLGAVWHQLSFTVHDAGHMGITHNFKIDTIIGIIIADFFGGLSLGWWKRNHNVHHIITNHTDHDPDIQHMPFFAISHRFFDSLYSTYHNRVLKYDAVSRFMIRIQHWTYYPILLLGRFNLYAQSWIYLFGGQAPRKGPAWWTLYLEILGQFVYWYWFGYRTVYLSIPTASSRFAFVLASHMVTAPLHVQITLSHFAMSTADLGVAESFPQRMLRTTMDVDCPQWLDFFHGGLQFQVIHHLYPRIPRHNLRKCQKMIMEFCQETNIPYTLFGFVDGNKAVIGRLKEVGQLASLMSQCKDAIVRGDVH